MPRDRLKALIEAELGLIDRVVSELAALRADIGDETPTLRDVVAAGGFLAQFYTGIENILKRLAVAAGHDLPEGERWHASLLETASRPSNVNQFALDQELATDLKNYLGFRHIVRNGYGMDLEWDRILIGIEALPDVFQRFEQSVRGYLSSDEGLMP